MRRTLVATVLALSLCGCGEAVSKDSEASGTTPERREVTASRPEVTGLTCDSKFRGSTTLEWGWTAKPSDARTFEEEASGWTNAEAGESVLTTSKTDQEAHAFVLRRDGTAIRSLDLMNDSRTGWHVDTMEYCANEFLP